MKPCYLLLLCFSLVSCTPTKSNAPSVEGVNSATSADKLNFVSRIELSDPSESKPVFQGMELRTKGLKSLDNLGKSEENLIFKDVVYKNIQSQKNPQIPIAIVMNVATDGSIQIKSYSMLERFKNLQVAIKRDALSKGYNDNDLVMIVVDPKSWRWRVLPNDQKLLKEYFVP